MPDIIERNATAARQLLECAAEIDRLRAINADMYEALNSLVASCETFMRGSGFTEFETARCLERPRAALAKANGQTES